MPKETKEAKTARSKPCEHLLYAQFVIVASNRLQSNTAGTCFANSARKRESTFDQGSVQLVQNLSGETTLSLFIFKRLYFCSKGFNMPSDLASTSRALSIFINSLLPFVKAFNSLLVHTVKEAFSRIFFLLFYFLRSSMIPVILLFI